MLEAFDKVLKASEFVALQEESDNIWVDGVVRNTREVVVACVQSFYRWEVVSG